MINVTLPKVNDDINRGYLFNPQVPNVLCINDHYFLYPGDKAEFRQRKGVWRRVR